jgi:hypothetical protein
MACHLITLDPKHASTAAYLIANKCANIQRVARLHSEDRAVPATTDETIRAAADEIARLDPRAASLPPASTAYLVGGLVNQLANLPVQIRIERWVAARFPELAEQQQRYLESDIAQTIAGASPQVERSVPTPVFERSNAMTYAYVRAAGELLGANRTQRYNDHPSIVRRGKALLALVGDADDESALADNRLVAAWAGQLGMERWFVWQDFESMPDSYFADTDCSDSSSPAR